jgi:hypothetical protein
MPHFGTFLLIMGFMVLTNPPKFNSKDKPKEEKVVKDKQFKDLSVVGYTLKSNAFIRCDKLQLSDCGVTLIDCINVPNNKVECVKEEDLLVLQEEGPKK